MSMKLLRLFCFSVLIAFLLFSFPYFSPDVQKTSSTLNWLFADVGALDRIAEAEQNISYVGVRLKTSSTSHGARTMEEIVIRKSAEYSYRKVLSVVGERKESVQNSEREREQRDGRRRNRGFRWHRHRNQFSTKEIQLIAKNYDLEVRPWGEKIAGYETDLLIIKPKFPGRPTKHIYFARQNGVIMRVEDFDAEGVLRKMFVYTRINLNPKNVETKWQTFQEEIKPEPRRSQSVSLEKAEEILKTKLIQPDYLPPGFQLQDVRIIKDRERTAANLIYTDGLLDLYIFETTGKPTRRGGSVVKLNGTDVHKHQRGSTHAFIWSSAGVHFHLFGAMPPAEMQKVVHSIIHKAGKK